MAVGVEDLEKRGDLTKPYVMANFDMVKNLPVIAKAGPAQIPNPEVIITLRPDVVLINTMDLSVPDQLQKKLRIPVVAVGYGIPSFDMKIFLRSIELTGEVLNRQPVAKKLTDYIRGLTREFSSGRPSKETAYVGGVSYKGLQGLVSTSNDFLPFKMAGIQNAVKPMGRKGQVFINPEYLLSADPDYIFVDANGFALVQKYCSDRPDYCSKLNAFKSKKAYAVLPDTSYFVNPEVMLANAFMMAKTVYPERYKNIDTVKKADEIFMMFTGKPLYGEFKKLTGGYRTLHLDAAGRLM